MGDSILIGSGKGGVGSTVVAVNLGISMSNLGKKVAIVDASASTPDISLALGIPFHIRGLYDILNNDSKLKNSHYLHHSGAKIIPGNIHMNAFDSLNSKKYHKLLSELKKNHDYVFVDCATGLGKETEAALRGCEKLITVTNPELPSVVNSYKLIQLARDNKVSPIGLILNNVGKHKFELSEKAIVTLLQGLKIIGRIPDDKNISQAMKNEEAVVHINPKSPSSREFMNIASKLSGIKKSRAKKNMLSAKVNNLKKVRDKVKNNNSKPKSKVNPKNSPGYNPNLLNVYKVVDKNIKGRKSIIESLKDVHTM
jgi:MinD-like ATPase involved in chromosome partitioning or flagellar assembly